MEAHKINVTDLRTQTREIMERVKYKGERFLVQTFGQPTAVIISVDDYNQLITQLESLAEHSKEQITTPGSGETNKNEQT